MPHWRFGAVHLGGLLLLGGCIMSIDGGIAPPPPPPPPPTTLPQYALTGTFNGKPVVIGANNRFGAAIYTIKFDGQEYLDSSDHGRELQTAWQMDGQGEGNNPTEAGSAANGSGSTSSTVILQASVTNNVLTTRSRPAFWYPVGGQVTSPHYHEKTVSLGYAGRNNILVHDIGIYFGSPYHSVAWVEGLTAYMPTAFSRLFTFDRATKVYAELPPSSALVSGTQPVIAATADLSRAVALVHQHPVHLYWAGKISGWPKLDASYFYITAPAGWYRWRTFTVFGSFQDVLDSANVIGPNA
jgi:hypothetical protein